MTIGQRGTVGIGGMTLTEFYTFHRSVRGHLHVIKNIPCEDNSLSFRGKDGQFYIAAVADGHGDRSCMRSADGSRRAVEIAAECLQEFAEAALRQPSVEREQDDKVPVIRFQSVMEQLENGQVKGASVLKPLTDAIVSKWTAWAEQELYERPLTQEELNQAGAYADAYRNGERLPHVYGTTLLAALMLPDYLILLQQGDGRCAVFYEDGSIQLSDELGMLDERCHENVTTSLCDADAAQTLWKHSVVLPLRKKQVMACFLSCDGVEDSYRDAEGLRTFYWRLICELDSKGPQTFEAWLPEYLPEFSKNGSGDDVSVAGMLDRERLRAFAEPFRLQAEAYSLSEGLKQLEEKKASMSRKHGILRERLKEQSGLHIQPVSECKNDRGGQEEYQKEYYAAKREFEEYDGKYQELQSRIEEAKTRIGDITAQIEELRRGAQEAQKTREESGMQEEAKKTREESGMQREAFKDTAWQEHNAETNAAEGFTDAGAAAGTQGELSVKILNRRELAYNAVILLLLLILIADLLVMFLKYCR